TTARCILLLFTAHCRLTTAYYLAAADRRAAIAHDVRLQDQIVFQLALRLDAQFFQHAMIRANGLFGRDHAIDDQPQELDESELVFGVVDLAAVERDAGAIFLRFADQLERVVGRAGAAAENADYQVRVVADQLFHGLGPVIDHLQE